MTVHQQVTQGFRLSPQQERIWRLEATYPNRFRARCSVSLTGPLDVERFQQAVSKVVAREEILRTSFHCLQDRNDPLQIIDKHRTELPQLITLLDASPEQQRMAVEAHFAEMREQPFDLANQSPLHWRLLRLDETEYVFLIEASALCHDCTSLTNLVREISEQYGGSRRVVADAMQYADFAEWQNELLENEDVEAGRAFWTRQKFSQAVEPQFPYERGDSTGHDLATEVLVYQLDAARLNELVQISGALAVSLPSFFLAAWQVLIARLTSQREFLIGSRFVGRSYTELERALGSFAKYAPLSCLIEQTATFSDVAQQTEATLAKATRQQEYFDWREFERATGGRKDAALFPLGFAFFEQPDAFTAGGLTLTIDSLSDSLEPFKLSLSCRLAGSTLALELQYDSQRLSRDDVQRLANQLDTLLHSAAQTPYASVYELEILGPQERQQLLVEFNNTATLYSSADLVTERFERQAQTNPDQIAVTFENDGLTYADLDRRANQLAHLLLQLGVCCESRVALCLNRSLDLPVALLAIMKAGGAYVPLDPTLPRERLHYMIAESGATIVLTESALNDRLPTDNVSLVCLDKERETIAAQNTAPLNRTIAPANLAYVIFTSGSTGRPKGVAIEHGQLAHYVKAILARLNLPAGSSFATLSTIATDLGNTAVFPSLCSGGSLRMVSEEESMSPEALGDYFARHPVDCLKVVPTHLSALLSTSPTRQLLPRKCLVLGGEATASALVEKIESLADCAVFNHYGPTETTVGAITFEAKEGALDQLPSQIPLGRPLANMQAYVLDECMRLTPIGVAGELYLGGAGVGRGYINRPELTAERFVPNPFSSTGGTRLYRTGDRARFLANGDIEFLGRLDHQVKLHGNRIELREIEANVVAQESVAEAVVQLSEDASGNPHLVAWVVAAPGQLIDPKSLRERLAETLPEFMIPYHYVTLEKLPLTATGKIDRAALPAVQISRSSEGFVAPRNSTEETLAEVWRKVLNVARVGVFDNFFELGGDSIMSIQIIARANQAGLRLIPRQLFQHQTIAELAQLTTNPTVVAAEQGLVTGTVPLTPIQHRFFEFASDWPHHYNQALMLETPAGTDVQLLRQVISHLQIHHDALRLRFRRGANSWRQWITREVDDSVFSEVDLSALPAGEQGSVIDNTAAELQASLNLTNGPVMRVAYFNRGEDRGRVLIIVHHLAIDIVSWWVLLEDLETVYQQLKRGQQIELPPKTASFKAWAERWDNLVRLRLLEKETYYWLNDARAGVARLPVDHTLGPNDVASAQTVSVALSKEETHALLQEIPATYNTQINDALLAALVEAGLNWTSGSELLLDLEGHGREDTLTEIDVSRTVGWFTTVFPVLLTRTSADPGEQLLHIKEQLRRVPNHGQGYGLLRYMSPLTPALEKLPRAEINFNYLGRLDAGPQESRNFARVNESVGPVQPGTAMRRYLLTVSGQILNEQLKLNFTYSANLHGRQTIEVLANSFISYLQALIASCGSPEDLRPSDFPNARLTQKELATVLARLGKLSNAGPN